MSNIAIICDGLLLICLLLLGYAWVLYPLVLQVVARRPAPVGNRPDPGEWPQVTVILSAHNEASVIADRLRNLQELAYPPNRLAVRVGVDGGSDNTADIARSAVEGDVRFAVQAFDENRGKVAVLKDLVEGVSEGLLVFTDANTRFAKDAIEQLARPFADPSIGGACGRLVFTQGSPFVSDVGHLNPSPEGAYWRWETRLKQQESAMDSCLGANGAIYAIRAELFWRDIPSNTVIDDFVIGMKVRSQGRRMVYEPRALAYEELPEAASEWSRRVRIGSGGYQALALCRECLRPALGAFAWSYGSHKVLRWLTPHLLLLAALVSALGMWLTCCPVMRTAHLAVLAGMVVALGCALTIAVRFDLPGISHLAHFTMMQVALFAGFLRFLRGDMRGTWTRTPRGGPVAAKGHRNRKGEGRTG